jgi:hypothetical protein
MKAFVQVKNPAAGKSEERKCCKKKKNPVEFLMKYRIIDCVKHGVSVINKVVIN